MSPSESGDGSESSDGGSGHSNTRRATSVAALLVVAALSGAAAGAITAVFIWGINNGTKFLWTDLPERVGVAPYKSWWLFAIPLIGGLLIGIARRTMGPYPEPLDASLATWKAGGRLEPIAAPKTFVTSIVVLTTGGPVGFEAALTGIIGGSASWVGDRIGSVGHLVRQAWGAETIESVPRTVHQLPYWLAAFGGLFTYHSMPFGAIDMGFRFSAFEGHLDTTEALAVFVFAAAVVVPGAWAFLLVTKAEHSDFSRRAPILIAMGGAVVFALMALPNDLVLFSGQQGIQHLTSVDNAGLAYLTVAKWLALIVAFVTGWRGGPIFPTFTAISAFAVLISGPVGIEPEFLMVAGIAAISVIFVKGSVPLAFALCLYPVPLSYTAVILVGCLGAAAALAIARSVGVLPTMPDAPATAPASGPSDTTGDPAGADPAV